MRLALAVQTPEVTFPLPVALLSGTWTEKLDKAERLGRYAGLLLEHVA